MERNKIFVGNVPYNCTKEEFKKCFEEMRGYINSDIIKRPRTELSRGFGFVVFNTEENAKKLLEENNIKLKDRILRFSRYSKNKRKYNQNNIYQVFIYDIGENITSEILKDKIEEYVKEGEITNNIIITKNSKRNAIVSLNEYNDYLVLLRTEIKIDEKKLNIKPLRKNNEQLQSRENRINYLEAYNAGYIVGHHDGYLEAVKDLKEFIKMW